MAPVPEPSTYVMMLIGLGALGLLIRRRTPQFGSGKIME
ncbi:MAG: PEP-CTERM sorting domain-containing protein [Candidatus Angelobacter sp.]